MIAQEERRARESVSSLLSFMGQMTPEQFVDCLYALKTPGLEMATKTDLVGRLSDIYAEAWSVLASRGVRPHD